MLEVQNLKNKIFRLDGIKLIFQIILSIAVKIDEEESSFSISLILLFQSLLPNF